MGDAAPAGVDNVQVEERNHFVSEYKFLHTKDLQDISIDGHMIISSQQRNEGGGGFASNLEIRAIAAVM